MSEADLYSSIPLAYSRGSTRLFRMNSGMAWSGTIVNRTPRLLTLRDYHPVKLGPTGMGDLIGWSGGGIFTSIECKSKARRPTREQINFIDLVRQQGGRAGIARSVEDAGIILCEELP